MRVQSASTSSLSLSQAAATDSVSGSLMVVLTGPLAKRALSPSPIGASAPGSVKLGAPWNVTSPVTSCVTLER